MAKDGRIEIDEPRLLQTQRDLRALAGRVTRVEGQLDRHPLLRCRYTISTAGAANPNTAAPGVEWLLNTTGAYETGEIGARGVDGRFTVVVPGWYEIQGAVLVDPDTVHQQLAIRRRINGTSGRLIGVTNAASRALNPYCQGVFNWHLNAAEGDVLSIFTELADAAGVMAPVVESGVPLSWIEFIYRSHV